MRYSFSALNHSFTTLFYPQILPKSLIVRLFTMNKIDCILSKNIRERSCRV